MDVGKRQTTCVLIPDIYFCLFSLCSGLHGSNFCCDETEQQSLWSSLQGESQCPPPPLPGQEGFGGPQRDGLVWWVEWRVGSRGMQGGRRP